MRTVILVIFVKSRRYQMLQAVYLVRQMNTGKLLPFSKVDTESGVRSCVGF